MSFFYNVAIDQIRFLLLTSAIVWSQNARPQAPAMQVPQTASGCRPLSALINAVRPEFAAKGLLTLAQTDSGAIGPTSSDLINQAFLKARLSASVSPLKPLHSNLSTRIGLTFFGQDLGTDTLTLQSRAAEDFAAHDWQHALELFQSIDVRGLPALTCDSQFTYDLSPYFHAAARLLSLQPQRALDIIPFILQNSLRPAAVPAALSLISNAKLSQSDTETTVVLLILALKETRPNPSEFVASLKDLPEAINRIDFATTNGLSQTERQNLFHTLRDYVIRNLDEPRCVHIDFAQDLPLRSDSRASGLDAASAYTGVADLNQALVAAYQPPITIAEASPTTIVEVESASEQGDTTPSPIYSELRHLVVDSEVSDRIAFGGKVIAFLHDLGRSDIQTSLSEPTTQTALIEGQVLRLLDNNYRSLRQALASQYLEAVAGALDGTQNDYVLLSDFILTDRIMVKNQSSQQAADWRTAVCNEGNADLIFTSVSGYMRK